MIIIIINRLIGHIKYISCVLKNKKTLYNSGALAISKSTNNIVYLLFLVSYILDIYKRIHFYFHLININKYDTIY